MLNEDRVKLMSKMALFEKAEGRRTMEIDKYSKRDFIFVQVIKAWVLSTIGFGMVFLLTLFLCVDFVAVFLAAVSLTMVLVGVIALYLICVILSFAFAKRKALHDYEEAKETMAVYRRYMKQLGDMYDSEQSSQTI